MDTKNYSDLLEGKNQNQIFRSFYDRLRFSDEPLSTLNLCQKQKDNEKSEEFLQAGIAHCDAKQWEDGIYKFTKSLRYAKYKSEQYALALIHRSEVYFTLKKYQSCIDGINLCLQARCSFELIIKSYLLKAKCFFILGDENEMQRTIDAGLRTLTSFNHLPLGISIESILDKYKKRVNLFMDEIALEFVDPMVFVDGDGLRRRRHINVFSSSNALKYRYSDSKFAVRANRYIKRGETVFQEQAYAVALTDSTHPTKSERRFVRYHCSYCLKKSNNCIPCKNCVHDLYCTEKCRNISWIDYHQWECNLMPTKMFRTKYLLPFRILLNGIRNKRKSVETNLENFNLLRDHLDSKINIHNYRINIKEMKEYNEEGLIESARTSALLIFLLKNNTNFFQHLKSTYFQNKNVGDLTYHFGGLFLKQSIQIVQKLLVVNSIDFSNLEPDSTSVAIATAICPSVSQIPHSCIPNICVFFVGDVCVVTATRDIQEGEPIFRAHMGMTYYKNSQAERRAFLKNCFIKCFCKACSNVGCSKDVLNSIPCLYCRGNSIESLRTQLPYFDCMDCNRKALLCRELQQRFQFCKEFSKFAAEENTLDIAIKAVAACRDILNPFHSLTEKSYKLLVKLRMKTSKIPVILEAIELFVECSQGRYENSYDHGLNLIFLCVLLSSFMQPRRVFQLRHFAKILNRWTELLIEAREIMCIYFPQWLDYLNSELVRIANMRLHFSLQFYRSK